MQGEQEGGSGSLQGDGPDGHFTHEGSGLDARGNSYGGKYGGYPDIGLPL